MMAAGRLAAAGGGERRSLSLAALAALALPVLGLALLLTRPELHVRWQHQPSHFWLVLGTAALSVVLALGTNEAASRRADGRVILVSLAFLVSAGFLALHALATPGVLLPEANTGFTAAMPVGLAVAALLAAVATSPVAGSWSARSGRPAATAWPPSATRRTALEADIAAGSVAVRDLGRVSVKGKREPVEAWELGSGQPPTAR